MATALVAAGLGTVGFVATAGAGNDQASDPRAELVQGNATTCAQVGFPASTILFTPGFANNADAVVSGTVTGNKLLNLELLDPAFAINAVVVKGGNAYNLYLGNFPDMKAPIAGGSGQPANISHWFVCYDPAPPDTTTTTTLTVVPPIVLTPDFTG
jgi:hypothetical protein